LKHHETLWFLTVKNYSLNKKQFLYPIKFTPILKEKIWGGTKLKRLFNKESKGDIGESWEISGVDNNVSIVENGCLKGESLTHLIKQFKEKIVGVKVYNDFGNTFPLLFKFIDAKQDLSVQLHPEDVLAKKRHNSFGKTEMWYVLETEKDANLILGFKEKMNEELYKKHLSENSLPQIIHFETVSKGDSFFIKPGTVHAIGAGVVLAEIQQTSDITYRIYDYNRPGLDGKLRELHNDLALEAIDYNISNTKLNYKVVTNEVVSICTSVFFQTNVLKLTKNMNRDVSEIDSFVVYMCVEGDGSIQVNTISEKLTKGDTVLIPAMACNIDLISNNATFLEIYIP